ncbi:MAG: hypothetical protein AB8I08_05855 [Sandaracinaceae bacterium]
MEIFEGQSSIDFHDLVMEVDGSEHRERSKASLRLRGESIDTPLQLEKARLVDNIDKTAPFGELLASGLAEPFLAWAPGDHVKARIHGVKVEEGHSIAVRGNAAYRTEPADGYRDSVARIEAVEVHALATGPDAATQLRALSSETPASKAPPKPAAKREAPVALWLPLALLTTGGAAVATGIALGAPGGPAVLLTGLAALSTALLLWRRKRFLPDLRADSEDLEGTGRRTGLGAYSTAALVAAHILLIAGGSLAFEFDGAPLAGMALLVVVLTGGCAVSLLRGGRRSFGRLRQLLGAAAKLEPNQWGAAMGRVSEGTYSRTRRHKKDSSTYTDSEGHTKTTTWWTFRDSVSGGRMRVDLDGGGTLEVVLGAGALVGSTRVLEHQDRLVETIEVGDAVRVVGRPTKAEGWRMEARGKASLLVLGTASNDPAGAARKALAAHLFTLFALAGLALMALAVAAS